MAGIKTRASEKRLDGRNPSISWWIARGSESGLPLALQLVRPRGTIVMKTTIASKHHLSLAAIVIDEITRRRIALWSVRQSDPSVAGQVGRRVEPDYPSLHARFVHDAMKSAVSPKAFKVVFDINSVPKGG